MISKKLAQVRLDIQTLQEEEKKLKADLEKQMQDENLTEYNDEFISVVTVLGTETKSLDVRKFEKEEPELYMELLNDYEKITKRKSYIRISLK